MSLEETLIVSPERGADMVALDDALQALAAVDSRKCQVVELRYFGGLSVEECAEALRVSPDTILRDWRLAKAWLRRGFRRLAVVTSSRWAEIERLYHAALEHDAGERAAFLAHACGDDDALRQEVASLLEQEGATDPSWSARRSKTPPTGYSRARALNPSSTDTRSSRSWARAGWARSIARGTSRSAAKSR